MNAKELAEKIIQELDCDSCQGYVRSYSESMSKLESLLNEALEEHTEEIMESKGMVNFIFDREKEAYLDAAKIADQFCKCQYKSGVHEVYVSDLIRQKANEL